MKKIAAIFVFFTMVLCSCGLFISYKLSLHNIRLHQRETILQSANFKNGIVTFSFPVNYRDNKVYDIVYVEEDEIMFNGKMYDIINEHLSADSIFIKCIPDKIEDEVRNEASRHIYKGDGISTQKNSLVIKFNPGPFTFTLACEDKDFTIKKNSKYFRWFYADKHHTSYHDVPSPPPRPLV